MRGNPNALRWDGAPGHYEVYYLTLTDPATGVGVWIRYTMVAPLSGSGEAALWFLAMDPRQDGGAVFGRKASLPLASLSAEPDPFALRIGTASLTDGTMSGELEGATWDLRWAPGRAYEHVHPALQATKIAKTVLVLPHADVAIEGSVAFGDRRIELHGARGGQAHLWGSKHASSWAWVHCNDFTTEEGQPVDAFIDGVSAIVPRLGREVGPNTPVVARIDGAEFRSTSPLRILRNHSSFGLEGWRFDATDGALRVVGEVAPVRDQLAGVTYHDPDGQLAYCYNTETASMRLDVQERSSGRGSGWSTLRTLTSSGRTHYEVGQREPAAGLELLTK